MGQWMDQGIIRRGNRVKGYERALDTIQVMDPEDGDVDIGVV